MGKKAMAALVLIGTIATALSIFTVLNDAGTFFTNLSNFFSSEKEVQMDPSELSSTTEIKESTSTFISHSSSPGVDNSVSENVYETDDSSTNEEKRNVKKIKRVYLSDLIPLTESGLYGSPGIQKDNLGNELPNSFVKSHKSSIPAIITFHLNYEYSNLEFNVALSNFSKNTEAIQQLKIFDEETNEIIFTSPEITGGYVSEKEPFVLDVSNINKLKINMSESTHDTLILVEPVLITK